MLSIQPMQSASTTRPAFWRRVLDERWLRWLLPVSIGLAAVIGLIMGVVAPVDGDDASFHLHWITAFYGLLQQGVMLPKWLPDGFHGFGAPTFYFYPPLTFFISSSLIWLTGIHAPDVIFNATGLFSTVASGAACYYLLRKLETPVYAALLGGLFYAFAPFRQFDLFTRSSLSEPMGFIFLPLILAGLSDVVRKKKGDRMPRWIEPNLLLSFSWAGLLLCAFPLAIAAGMTILMLWLAFRTSVTKRQAGRIAMSLIIGTTLVAFHYLPAYYFQRYVQTNTYLIGIPDGNWVPALLHGTELRFVIQDLLIYTLQIGILIWYWNVCRPQKGMSFSKGVFTVVLFWSLIETPYLSSPLWDHLLLFHLLRFHARFSIFAVLLLSVLAFSPVAGQVWQRFGRTVVLLWTGIASLLALTVIFHVQAHPHGTSEWMDPPEYLPLTTRPAVVAMETLFLPHVLDSFIEAVPPLLGGESMRLAARTPRQSVVTADLSSPHDLVIHQFSWPTWTGRVDGRAIAIAADSIGRVSIPLGLGKHILSLNLETSPIETAGMWISGASFSLLLLFGLLGAWHRPSRAIRAGGAD